MVTYHTNEIMQKLVRYIEKYYPKVPLIVRPKNNTRNCERGYAPGQPDILIIEPKCRYMGLAIWAKPWERMTKYELRFKRRLYSNSYNCVVSDVYDDLEWGVTEFMLGHGRRRTLNGDRMEVLGNQMEVLEARVEAAERKNAYNFSFVRECNPLTGLDYQVLDALTEFFNEEDPTAVIIPGVGADGQPDLMVISPDLNNDGVAIWFSYDNHFGCNGLSAKQLDFVRGMACRSYVIITVKHRWRTEVWKKVRHYINGKNPCLN